jgi:hypothetical protein
MSGLQIGFGLFKNVLGSSSSEIVFFDTIDPNTIGTIFNPNTPEQTDTLYVSSSDGSIWIWNGVNYEKDTSNEYWESGSSGIFSIRAKNDSGLDATGDYSYSEGYNTIASGTYSHAEGYNTTAEGNFSSHAEGNNTVSSGGFGSHAEGDETTASGEASHAEGQLTTASGAFSHAEGILSIASGNVSSASGLKSNTFGVVARRSHSSGDFGNLTFNNAQTSKLVITGLTQNDTPYTLRSSYPDAVTVNSILVLQNYNSIHFKGSIVGSTANNTNRVAWNIEGFITRELGVATTTLIMNNVSVIDNTIGWGVPTLEADTTLGGLLVKVTGEATTTIAWVCVIHTTEIIY